MGLSTSLILIGANFAAVLLGTLITSRNKADSERVARLEKKLDALLSQAGLEPNVFAAGSLRASTVSPDVLDLIRRGRKIEAIKLYRELNAGVGLKQAKDAVEQMERSLT